MTVRYQGDYEGTGQLLRTPEMTALVARIGEKALEHARAISPVRTGEYAGSWRLEVTSDGGPKANRAEARVINDAGDRVLSDVADGHDVPALVLGYLEAGAFL